MGACCSCKGEERGPSPVGEWVRLGIAGVVAAQSMTFGLAINLSPPTGWTRWILHGALALSAVVVFALAGGPILRNSWRALLRGKIVFDQLFLIGILAAFGASLHCTLTGVGHVYYEVVALLVAIHTFGGLITDSRRREALAAAADFGREFSECERLSADGSRRRVPVEEIFAGDRIFVPVGGAVSVDGNVVEGTAFVREAALTGEPFPVVKRPGDSVRAGSHALDGTLVLEAATAGNERGLDRLIAALEEARARPSRLQRQADRLAAWFLPTVILIAAGTFAFWTGRTGWTTGLFNALAVLLVACPCAMGIATPVAVWSALAAFARRGLVARNADCVEKLALVDTVIFDKTGTLGQEEMEIVDFVAAEGFDRERLRVQAAALESVSDHPVARAFRFAGLPRRASAPEVRNARILPGVGIEGLVDGRTLGIGNRSLLGGADDVAMERLFPDLRGESQGSHEIFLVLEGVPAGVAILREKLRENARETIARLDGEGFQCRVMTGDRPEAAAAHGLEHVEAGLTPSEKASRVRDLEAAGRRTLFVGDGINDAAALEEATAGVAIRGGEAMARESSDAELAGASIAAIPEILLTARNAVRAIRGNLLYAAAYNALGVTLAVMGYLHPVAAAVIMVGSSFLVTSRALRDASREVRNRTEGTEGTEGVPPSGSSSCLCHDH